MPTTRQKKAVENLVENGGIIGKAMIDAGYTPATAHTPQKLTESKGFREVLKEYGLTEGLITTALVEDIEKKPGKRYAELNLGAEILGMKDNNSIGNKTLIVVVSGESANRYKVNPNES